MRSKRAPRTSSSSQASSPDSEKVTRVPLFSFANREAREIQSNCKIFAYGLNDLLFRRRQFHLDIIRVAKGQHVDAESIQVFDLTVRDTAFVEEFDRFFKLSVTSHV
jgi:hypothetical protein